MLNIVAEKLGVEVIETPVGFKHVGAAMRKYNPIIAGEESGGLSIQGHIPEKDGILANLLVLEAMAYEHKSLVQMQNDLANLLVVNSTTQELTKNYMTHLKLNQYLKNFQI